MTVNINWFCHKYGISIAGGKCLNNKKVTQNNIFYWRSVSRKCVEVTDSSIVLLGFFVKFIFLSNNNETFYLSQKTSYAHTETGLSGNVNTISKKIMIKLTLDLNQTHPQQEYRMRVTNGFLLSCKKPFVCTYLHM